MAPRGLKYSEADKSSGVSEKGKGRLEAIFLHKGKAREKKTGVSLMSSSRSPVSSFDKSDPVYRLVKLISVSKWQKTKGKKTTSWQQKLYFDKVWVPLERNDNGAVWKVWKSRVHRQFFLFKRTVRRWATAQLIMLGEGTRSASCSIILTTDKTNLKNLLRGGRTLAAILLFH